MRDFYTLVRDCVEFNQYVRDDVQRGTMNELQITAATRPIKTLQMLRLQNAITAVGMFSMFDAILQQELGCADGFHAAGELLKKRGATALMEQFCDLQLGINVLKHGRGRSYDALIKKARVLSFKIKLPNELFFSEGDVSEVSTLIDVDHAFLLLCAEVIREVSSVACAGDEGRT